MRSRRNSYVKTQTDVKTNQKGNHAQALSLAARENGIPAHIVMPTISPPPKIAATKGYGANITFSGSTSTEREAVTREVIEKTGARLVPPYDRMSFLHFLFAFLSLGVSSESLQSLFRPSRGPIHPSLHPPLAHFHPSFSSPQH